VTICAVESIDPIYARELLRGNTANFRTVDPKLVSVYAEEMSQGRWHGMNGETIIIDDLGRIADGQHRLLAIVKSNKTIDCLVVRESPSTACVELTRGSGRPRTTAQWLQRSGFKNANAIAAICRGAIAHQKGIWGQLKWDKEYLLNSEVIEFAEKHREAVTETAVICNRLTGMPMSCIGAVILVGSGLGKPTRFANWFLESLKPAAMVESTEPVFHLRNRILVDAASKTQKTPAYVKRILTTIAWNKTVNGEPCNQLKVVMVGPKRTKPPSTILIGPGDVEA